MKVLLNIESLTPPLSGIGHYTFQLAKGLEQHPDIATLNYFSFSLLNTFATQKLGPPRKTLPRPLIHVLRHIPFIKRFRRWISEFNAGRSEAVGEANLYHGPNYTLYPYDGPSVVTVHDLSFIHFPQHHEEKLLKFMQKSFETSLQQANKIITVSEFVRQDLIKVMGLPPEKVHAVYNGVNVTFHPRPREELSAALSRHGLENEQYLLSVCTLEPRKNLTGLVAAYARLPEDVRRRHPLVIAGAKGWLAESIEQAMEPLERIGQVRRLGYVEADDLAFIYAGAHAFAYPSFYEGFGLPPLEAMASGVPVLTSDRASLPEVVGKAAILVNPDDVDDMAGGLERLLLDEPYRLRATKEGLARAAHFSWKNCVDGTVEVYKQALA